MRKIVDGAFVNGQNDGSEEILKRTQGRISEALHVLGYGQDEYDLLKLPLCVLTVRFPVLMDDGMVRVFTGYRSQHNHAIGPVKGGIRLQPTVTQSEIEVLSILMSIKSGIANLPFGGGKGAIVCDPREMSFGEIERVSREYVRAIRQIVGPTKDVPAPDVFSNAQNMAWMVDEYSRLTESDMPGFMTGKPLVLGGTHGRENVTARGVAICLEEASKAISIDLKNARVIVQGFENIGSTLAKHLYDVGAKVVGLSDSYGALFQPDGLNITELLEKRDSFGTVTKLYQNRITNDELLSSKCDILVLSGVKQDITLNVSQRIQASVVVEALNQTVSDDVEQLLSEKKILLVPDMLANLGPSIISYLEWVQNRNGYYWTVEEVEHRLTNIIRSSFQCVHKAAKKYGTNLRLAAYIVGVERIIAAAKLRNWI